MAELRVVAVLGTGVVPADTPVLRADDLGVVRGDGVFETMHVRSGEPWLLTEHLARLARSAERLDLPLPAADELERLVREACAAWPGDTEGALRLVCTRGPESGGSPTVFATVRGVGPAHHRARAKGVSVRTAALDVEVAKQPAAPWLLSGAKTLSYAVNMASLRWGADAGADDVLWVSADGYALEGPTSSLVWLTGDTLCTVPPERTGVLAGTTAAWLLSHAGELGWRGEERLVRPAELTGEDGNGGVDGLWFTSSVRGLAEIHTLDGVALTPSPETPRIRALLGFG